jgi:hypothetical protein
MYALCMGASSASQRFSLFFRQKIRVNNRRYKGVPDGVLPVTGLTSSYNSPLWAETAGKDGVFFRNIFFYSAIVSTTSKPEPGNRIIVLRGRSRGNFLLALKLLDGSPGYALLYRLAPQLKVSGYSSCCVPPEYRQRQS